jgi:hypothetical protein
MNDNIKTNIPSVYISDLEKLAKRIRNVSGEENVEISFEFIIASLFPTSWKNMQTALSHQYTLGYIQGRKDEVQERRKRIQADSESDCYCE